jgi:LuxR family transcriptional regulator, maltose regulon positive regulatory protein
MHAAAPIPFVPRTKLRPPRLPDDLLRRPRLLEKLGGPQTLSLVVAPAGYGKTALVSTWLAQCGLPYAWLSLESDDNSLSAFLTGLAAALQRLAPVLYGELLSLLQAPAAELTPAAVLPMLLNTLNELEERFVVVLDDYHHVRDPVIHELICGFIEHPPRALHLVLTARYDPPLSPRLRYRGNVTEIRARELGFTEQEAQVFLSQFATEPIAAQAIAGLVTKSEGWAVPLRLAAVLISQGHDAAALDGALRRCERSLLDYLDAEVIGQLPSGVQTFLTRTSLLNLLNASLCDAVLGEAQHSREQVSDQVNDQVNGSKATLQMLADNGIFMEQLDDTGEWFRYQELFRHLLQRRLRSTHSSEDIDAFTRRAKLWHEQHDLPAHLENPGTECVTQPVAPAGTTLVVAAPQAERWANSRPAAGEQVNSLLTYREMDVLSLLCERLTNKEIANNLGISVETVRQHSVHVYRKLGVAGRRQAVVQAYALGLPVPPMGRVQVGSQIEGASRPAPAGVDR